MLLFSLHEETICAHCPWFGSLLSHLSEHNFNLWRLGQLYLNGFLLRNLILFWHFWRRKKIGGQCSTLIALMTQFWTLPCIQALYSLLLLELCSQRHDLLWPMGCSQWDLNRSWKCACTVGLICFSPLVLSDERARASLLEGEKCVDQGQVVPSCPSHGPAQVSWEPASQPQPCEHAQPRSEEPF